MKRRERIEKRRLKRTLRWFRREWKRQLGSHLRWYWLLQYGPPRPLEIGHYERVSFFVTDTAPLDGGIIAEDPHSGGGLLVR